MMNRWISAVPSALFRRYTTLRIAQFHSSPIRVFSTSNVILAKKVKVGKASKGGKKVKEEEEESADSEPFEIDFAKAEAGFKEVLEAHQRKISETRLGKSNPTIFDKLKIDIDGKKVLFTSVAQCSVKAGRNLIITVFDAKDAKHIISSVLASGLNMNPQSDPTNPQLLKVPLPPPSSETKKEIAKLLKVNFENFRNSSRGSLSEVRAHVLKDVKKKAKSDTDKKLVEKFEKLHKQYVELLNNQYKAAEKSLA